MRLIGSSTRQAFNKIAVFGKILNEKGTLGHLEVGKIKAGSDGASDEG